MLWNTIDVEAENWNCKSNCFYILFDCPGELLQRDSHNQFWWAVFFKKTNVILKLSLLQARPDTLYDRFDLYPAISAGVGNKQTLAQFSCLVGHVPQLCSRSLE